MFLNPIILFILVVYTYQQKTNGTCTLSMQPPQDPFPSLLQCYIYNSYSCCLSVHDETISSIISEFFSSSCSKKYSPFLNLLCYGCHPYESNYTDHSKKTLRVCDYFLQNLWGTNLSEPSTMYDNCGFKTSQFSSFLNNSGAQFIIPSLVFNNVTTFLNSFTIPFFDGYTVEIITTNGDTTSNCFGGFSTMLQLPLMLIIFSILAIIFN